MWKRKDLKRHAKESLKRNYLRMIAVCFLIAMLTGAYASSTTLIDRYDSSAETTETVANPTATTPNSEVVMEAVDQFLLDYPDASASDTAIVRLLSQWIDAYTNSDSTSIALLKAVSSIIGGRFSLLPVFLFAGAVLGILYRIFVGNVLKIGEKRFFIEARLYNRTKISKIFYLYQLHAVLRPAWIMLCRSVFLFLWSLTVIGGIIKYYEYAMIPYILAENPTVGRKEAFALSKQMMKGNKWRLCLLSLSFLGWEILSGITLGLLNLLFVNPYRTATEAELFMTLRKEVTTRHTRGWELFNDRYIARVASSDELLINKALYDNIKNGVAKIAVIADGQYPAFLFPVQPPEKRIHKPIRADRKYSLVSYVMLFFTFALIGWLWEIGLSLVKDGVFVNRGTMFGPWLPIYGTGGVLVILFLRKWMHKPVLTFFLIMTICSVIEYSTSCFLEYTRGVKWWDYTGYFLNLNGRICLEGAVAFGLGGCAFLYYIAPRLDDLYARIPMRIRLILCAVLCFCFGADFIYSQIHPHMGIGITEYDTFLGKVPLLLGTIWHLLIII